MSVRSVASGSVLKIVFRMLSDKKPYDAELHARNQIKHGSWVLAFVPKLEAQTCEWLLRKNILQDRDQLFPCRNSHFYRLLKHNMQLVVHDRSIGLLIRRRRPNSAFCKGLIWIAGAIVHVQKAWLVPAAALLRLARGHLARYPTFHERLDLGGCWG